MQPIAIVDYGAGNVQAFINAYASIGIPAIRAADAPTINGASRLILPGVGSFDWALERLNRSKLRSALEDSVLTRGTPVLGVCVGMQMLGESSEEGIAKGLGWLPSKTVRFEEETAAGRRRLPHMGWSDVEALSHPIFASLQDPRFYFLHSYYVIPECAGHAIAFCNYHDKYVSAVAKDNIVGVQFHPEKSHGWGTQLLKNFYHWRAC